jgi:hypothetical protein
LNGPEWKARSTAKGEPETTLEKAGLPSLLPVMIARNFMCLPPWGQLYHKERMSLDINLK